MPEFHRVIWASQEAKEIWEYRIAKIAAAWKIVEYESVFENLRKAALIYLSIDELIGFQKAHFGNANIVPIAKDENGIRVLITKEDPKYFLSYWEARNDAQIGRELGFPECCCKFFDEHWSLGYRDLTLFQRNGKDEFLVGNWYACCSVLYRTLGVRLVPYLPCSFTCQPTTEIADNYLSLMFKLGYNIEAGFLTELLITSTEYSALHGISETINPAFKLITNTDYTQDKKVIWLHGTPITGGVKGKDFPHNGQGISLEKKQPIITGTKEPEVTREEKITEDTWTANGFPTYQRMENAHAMILNFVNTRPFTYDSVIDLGCGNGELLVHFNRAELFGIDSENKGNVRPDWITIKTGFIHTEIEEINKERFDLALIAKQRLLEGSVEFGRVKRIAKHVVIYDYQEMTIELAK